MTNNADLLREARRELSYVEMIAFHGYLIGVLAYRVQEDVWKDSIEDAKSLICADRDQKGTSSKP